ncbi:MAG: cation transporter [Bacteroidota bacterium]
MKSIISSLIVLTLLVLLIPSTQAQQTPSKNATCTFTVHGVCDQCKARIEKAAKIPGVKFASWDKETQQLKVIYNSRKTDQASVEKAVAKVGHDTKSAKADSTTYRALPACCSYREDHVHPH